MQTLIELQSSSLACPLSISSNSQFCKHDIEFDILYKNVTYITFKSPLCTYNRIEYTITEGYLKMIFSVSQPNIKNYMLVSRIYLLLLCQVISNKTKCFHKEAQISGSIKYAFLVLKVFMTIKFLVNLKASFIVRSAFAESYRQKHILVT